MKSFKPKEAKDHDGQGGGGRNVSADFRGEVRSNDTHATITDPDAMLYRKGPGMEAKLCFIGHGLMENRSGLIIDTRLTRVSGHAERLAALDMIEPLADRPRAITLGADRGYDAADFVEELRTLNVRPHVAQNTNRRRSAIDGRTTRHPGCRIHPYPQAHRGGLRLDHDGGWDAQDRAARAGQGRPGFRLRYWLRPESASTAVHRPPPCVAGWPAGGDHCPSSSRSPFAAPDASISRIARRVTA